MEGHSLGRKALVMALRVLNQRKHHQPTISESRRACSRSSGGMLWHHLQAGLAIVLQHGMPVVVDFCELEQQSAFNTEHNQQSDMLKLTLDHWGSAALDIRLREARGLIVTLVDEFAESKKSGFLHVG